MKMKKAAAALLMGLTASALAVSPAFASDSGISETESVVDAESVESTVEEPEELPRPEYRALDFVTLGEYKGLTLEVDPIDITEEQIDAQIESDITLSEDGSETFTEGTVEDGDVANIDFEGKKDGVAFDGGTGTGYDLEIGSGTFIPGFEEGLVGVAIGDTVDLDLTFPESYGNADLAGQDVVFTVTVNSVKRYKEMDDALAAVLSEGAADTVEAYREWTKGKLTEEALNTRTENAKTELLEMAAANMTISEYPQDLVDYTVNQITEYFESYAAMYGVDFGTFLTYMFGLTEEQFPAEAESLAQDSIAHEFCIGAIAETEKLLPEGDELLAAYDELAQKYGYESGEQLLSIAGEYSLNYTLAQGYVEDFLLENANLVERQPEADSFAEEAESGVNGAEVEEMEDADSTAE